MGRSLSFTVHGSAEPRGSKDVVPIGRRPAPGMPDTRRRILKDSNPRSGPWMSNVKQRAGEAMAGQPLLAGPLRLRVVFFRPRPVGHLRKDGTVRESAPRYPMTRPDTTKLLRAVEDAFKGTVWTDDAQVVDQFAYKRWGAARVEVLVEELEG